MPDLNKKYGPFTGKAWAIGGVGGAAAYLLFRWYENRKASEAATLSTADTSGGTIPASGSGSTSTAPQTLAAWEQAALGFFSSPQEGLNAVSNYLSGNCVDQAGFTGLGAAIAGLGLPPGITNFNTITVCGTSTGSGSGTQGGSSSGTGVGAGTGAVGTGTQQNQPTPTSTANLAAAATSYLTSWLGTTPTPGMVTDYLTAATASPIGTAVVDQTNASGVYDPTQPEFQPAQNAASAATGGKELLYKTASGQIIQTDNTPANLAEITSSGGSIIGAGGT